MENRKFRGLTSASLHVLAMLFMLCDHLWATVAGRQAWLTCVGRLAYPMFAFMITEGYFHTRNLKKYMLRLLAFALVSEIPFDLMYSGTVFYPYHQNVLWTFLIALAGIYLMDKTRAEKKLWKTILVLPAVVLAGFLAGMAGFTDFYGFGVLTVFVFYFFHGRKWWCFLGQLALLWWINVELLGGQYYPVTIFGLYFELSQQGLALLALIPIWLYRGEKGFHAPWFRYVCYGFYPAHCLILGLLSLL